MLGASSHHAPLTHNFCSEVFYFECTSSLITRVFTMSWQSWLMTIAGCYLLFVLLVQSCWFICRCVWPTNYLAIRSLRQGKMKLHFAILILSVSIQNVALQAIGCYEQGECLQSSYLDTTDAATTSECLLHCKVRHHDELFNYIQTK